jgi:putative transposase
MARRLRVQYEGALYHVLNRGNYRRGVFETAGAAQAFVTTLEEASAQYDWRVYAYVVMRNHYHLAIQTPKANLVDGMHWLQGTLATRFNRFRNERGHLFQGRYQAILLEDFSVIARVANYIHLNPVRAKVIGFDHVTSFRWSSLGRFVEGNRFAHLVAHDWLTALGFSDHARGWDDYLEQLADLSGSPAEQKREGFATLSRGWAIGTPSWRKALAQEYSHQALSPGLEAEQLREMKEARWSVRFNELMRQANRTAEDVRRDRKSAAWKVALATTLRREEGASIGWLTQALRMGKASAVRNYLCRNHPSKK